MLNFQIPYLLVVFEFDQITVFTQQQVLFDERHKF